MKGQLILKPLRATQVVISKHRFQNNTQEQGTRTRNYPEGLCQFSSRACKYPKQSKWATENRGYPNNEEHDVPKPENFGVLKRDQNASKLGTP